MTMVARKKKQEEILGLLDRARGGVIENELPRAVYPIRFRVEQFEELVVRAEGGKRVRFVLRAAQRMLLREINVELAEKRKVRDILLKARQFG